MLNIKLIKAFTDNYIFHLTCSETGMTAVVDPGDAPPVMDFIGEGTLDYILITHHHADHIGGVEELKDKYGCQVIGHQKDAHRLPALDIHVNEGDSIKIGASIGSVLETYGHTLGHISYYFEDSNALFCGDTLFSGGCGRLFEGTAKNLFNSFVKYKKLPINTNIYCAHEYTKNNLTFLLNICPDNQNVQSRLQDVKKLREQGIPTIPSTLEEELRSNLFLTAETVEDLAKIRALKDNY